jgi:transposase
VPPSIARVHFVLYFYVMTNTSAPDYRTLYEESQKQLAAVELLYKKQEKSLLGQIEEYKQQLNLALIEANSLRAKLFGIKSDNRVKRAIDGNQLELFSLGASQEDLSASEEQLRKDAEQANREQEKSPAKGKGTRGKQIRMALPQHIEREEVVIDPQENLDGYKVIGEEVTEVLVMVPATFKVKRIVRRKWALENNHMTDKKGVLIAPMPSRTVKRGLFDESVMAHLLISKYVDHLPLYRLQKMFARMGVHIPMNTLTDNTAAGSQSIKPLYNALRREVLANRYLQMDETTMKVLGGGKKNACHTGYFWACHAPPDGLVFFQYSTGRDQGVPRDMLMGFKGVLQTDGYEAYRSVSKGNGDVNHLYCMAHIRRKFDEAAYNNTALAAHAVGEIAKLYKIEKEIREADPPMTEPQIVRKRVEQAMPVLDGMKAWMMEHYGKVAPKSPIGKALAYALSLWDNMYFYTVHGELQIDNNAIENAIRPIALGRKNYLFAGTHETAQNAAMVYSLFATCKKHDVNPQEWLTDILAKINDPNYEGKFSDLLPHRWKHKSQEKQ